MTCFLCHNIVIQVFTFNFFSSLFLIPIHVDEDVIFVAYGLTGYLSISSCPEPTQGCLLQQARL